MFARISRFFTHDIWRPDDEVGRLRWGARLGRRSARVAYCTVRGFVSQRRTFHAAALTYYSALSIVPFLAFSFSVVKGLGGYRVLMKSVIEPWIDQTFPGNQPIQKALHQMLLFVQQTNLTTLGAIGLLTLAYGAVSLLSTTEQAFNDIWGVVQSRPLLRRTTNYVTLIVLTPLLAITAASLTTAAQSSALMARFEALPLIGDAVGAAFRLSSLVMLAVALAALYVIMPNTRVRLSAAVTGALVGAILWQLALILQVNSQRAIASYSALYSGFSAIPIFFVWMYVSWTIVLAGAEIASSFQHEAVVRQRRRAHNADQAFRERLAVQIMAQAATAFLRRSTRPTSESLARELRAPMQVTSEVVARLTQAELILPVGSGELPELTLAADVDQVRVFDILQACRHSTHRPNEPSILETELVAPAASAADALEREAERSPHNVTLRELTAWAVKDRPASAAEASEGGPPRGRGPSPSRPPSPTLSPSGDDSSGQSPAPPTRH